MKIDVKGKICVVTGSTKGIGKGIAEALAENGGTVVICSRKQNECDAVAAEIREKYGVDAIGVSADITKTEAIENLFNTVMEKYGRVDVLVNNAGSAITKRAEDLTEEDFDHVLALDLRAVFFCSQAAGKIMIKQKSGKIISIASVLGVGSAVLCRQGRRAADDPRTGTGVGEIQHPGQCHLPGLCHHRAQPQGADG